ncbi:alkaline phosphatase D family protein [Thalassospira sp.]|uniref:alkaline phosphatase D family protein n=1 Tax=Thalassospira sp. TaxID=1912094 RepID=UPI003AA806DB
MNEAQHDETSDCWLAGPFLFGRGCHAGAVKIAALLITRHDDAPPVLSPMGEGSITPVKLAEKFDRSYWRYDFTLPRQAGAWYAIGDNHFPVSTDFGDNLDLAFVSCNGQEQDDLDRPIDQRNALWADLCDRHDLQPFSLLLHGGDQIYADNVWQCHPDITAWQKAPNRQKKETAYTDDMADAVLKFYLDHYITVYCLPQIAYLMARVPSVMMWDDHDIFDGWGSHPGGFQDMAVARGMFDAARYAFMLMQLCIAPDGSDLPDSIYDPTARSLGWRYDYPGMSIIAPDLRSERRRDALMGDVGWAMLEKMVRDVPKSSRILLMSSVPAIGPRLSVVEAILSLMPKSQKYEDDLRDQWQSRAHRREWRRFLELIEDIATTDDHDVTILSGEIHLATRGVFETRSRVVHQLVASGIAHNAPPNAFARCLGFLAWLGDNPLPGRPTRLRPLPGQSSIYVAERNYLTLTRHKSSWHANWRLEQSGLSPDIKI